jgi:hypothetical protein
MPDRDGKYILFVSENFAKSPFGMDLEHFLPSPSTAEYLLGLRYIKHSIPRATTNPIPEFTVESNKNQVINLSVCPWVKRKVEFLHAATPASHKLGLISVHELGRGSISYLVVSVQ